METPTSPAYQSFMETTAAFIARVNDAIINPILALLFAAALLYFLWGGFIFIISAGNDTARSEGRQHMLWGVIGMVLMVSVFALLNIGLNTFGVDRGRDLPQQLPLLRESKNTSSGNQPGDWAAGRGDLSDRPGQ